MKRSIRIRVRPAWVSVSSRPCRTMTASPFDAAIHDAFGKLHARNCFLTYGPDLMVHDLSHYLGAEFKGEYLDRYVLRKAKARMPLYHLVGAVDIDVQLGALGQRR